MKSWFNLLHKRLLRLRRYKTLLSELSRLRVMLFGLPPSVTARDPKLLNLGCGPSVKRGFINVDFNWNPGIDFCWDFRRRLPLKDESVDGVFTEHMLEHLEFSDAITFLKDLYRAMKPGAVCRIVVPDGGLYLRLYHDARQGQSVNFPYLGVVGEQDLKMDSLVGFTPIMAVNRIFRGYGHQFAYDDLALSALLRFCGFVDVRQESFGSGADPRLVIDSEYRAPQSLYIEGSKPK